MRYYALVECLEDGSTYVQAYNDFYDLIDLFNSLGKSYRIALIY